MTPQHGRSERKPTPTERVTSENARASLLSEDASFRMTGADPVIDADVLRALAELAPSDVADVARRPHPRAVVELLDPPRGSDAA